MLSRVASACALAAVLGPAGTSFAQFFTDGLDSTANWTVANQADAFSAVTDYSSVDLNALFGIGSGGITSIPEAPNAVGGSAPTTGVVFAANTLGGAAAANLIGAVPNGNADLALDKYEVQFDLWINVPVPIPAGGTEQALWGVGRTTTTALGRNNRLADGDGTWGWLAGENGYFTEDTAVYDGTTRLADLANTEPGEGAPFMQAFTNTSLSATGAPGNTWVTVTMTVNNNTGNVGVFYNGVPFFFEASASRNGDVMLGYEDPFGSLSGAPDFQFGVIDNVIIDDQISIPEPASATLVATLLAGSAYRRRRG